MALGYCYIGPLLFHVEQAWKKMISSSCFDVTMSKYNQAELCELTGIYTQPILKDMLNKKTIGLYRDDGLTIPKEINNQHTD